LPMWARNLLRWFFPGLTWWHCSACPHSERSETQHACPKCDAEFLVSPE
jgi:rubrerythrin